MAHPGGRPTLYKPEYCQEIVAFFSKDKYKEVDEKITAKGVEKVSIKRLPECIPFFSAFARKIGVTEETLLEWGRVHPEFSEAYKIAKAIQKEFLIENGLAGLYNPAFAIFTAKNITDMRDKTEREISGGLEVRRIDLPNKAAIGDPIDI